MATPSSNKFRGVFAATEKVASEQPPTPLKLSKHQDPAYKGYYLTIRKETHLEATHIAKKNGFGNLSELTEKLLSEYVAKHCS